VPHETPPRKGQKIAWFRVIARPKFTERRAHQADAFIARILRGMALMASVNALFVNLKNKNNEPSYG